jgi:hypothetical protein
MKNFGKLLILFSILIGILLGCQIVSYFGVKLGAGIISLLFMGGIALSLVMAGHNSSDEDLFLEEFLKDSPKN